MIKRISILGCGWLGFPLAKFLKEKNFVVKGSTTHFEKVSLLKESGIEPYLISFNPEPNSTDLQNFLDCDLLIINIPPSLRSQSEDFHKQQMLNLKKMIDQSKISFVLYVSSTSVYPDLNRTVVEQDVVSTDQADNKTLFFAEELFRKDSKYQTTIVRCAGLAGYDRNLVKFFAGKSNLKMGNAPVNLIHRDDVVEIIYSIIKKQYWNQTLNISAPSHPLRKELYPSLATKYNFPLPQYDPEDQSPFKIISTEKLNSDFNYQFHYPDPLEFKF